MASNYGKLIDGGWFEYDRCFPRRSTRALHLLHAILPRLLAPSHRPCPALRTRADEQDGTSDLDYAVAVDMAEDESVIICGFTYGSYRGVNAGSTDMVAIKLSSDGDLQWAWQVGITNLLRAMAEGSGVRLVDVMRHPPRV